jgi:hypothetical protein
VNATNKNLDTALMVITDEDVVLTLLDAGARPPIDLPGKKTFADRARELNWHRVLARIADK